MKKSRVKEDQVRRIVELLATALARRSVKVDAPVWSMGTPMREYLRDLGRTPSRYIGSPGQALRDPQIEPAFFDSILENRRMWETVEAEILVRNPAWGLLDPAGTWTGMARSSGMLLQLRREQFATLNIMLKNTGIMSTDILSQPVPQSVLHWDGKVQTWFQDAVKEYLPCCIYLVFTIEGEDGAYVLKAKAPVDGRKPVSRFESLSEALDWVAAQTKASTRHP